jgi:DegV family protein with EDD domain
MQLTAENTAIVLDSTADYPDGPQRFPNWRVVPLYVRFGQESFRDYTELGPRDFYDRLRTAPELPTTSQPTPGDFLETYRELERYERILSLHIPLKLSGTVESARVAGEELGGGKVRAIDSGTVSGGLALLAIAVQEQLERGTTDGRSTTSSGASRRRAGSSLPSTRSSSWPRAVGSARRLRWPGRC